MNSVIFLKIMLRIGQLGICEGEVSMEKEEDRKISMKVILGCENVCYLGSNTGGNPFGPDFTPFQRAERRKPTDEIKITNVPIFFLHREDTFDQFYCDKYWLTARKCSSHIHEQSWNFRLHAERKEAANNTDTQDSQWNVYSLWVTSPL